MTSAAAWPSPPSKALSKALGKPRRRRSLIGLTPLIDVVFILLIFFMLASRFLDWRAIDLNSAAEAAPGAVAENVLLVEVTGDGLVLAGAAVTLDELERKARDRFTDGVAGRAVVKPAPGVPLQRTVDALDRLKAAGVSEMTLVRDGELRGAP